MKIMIAILALLGVASASFYGLYPEQQQYWGPYNHLFHQETINTPWFYKYGQTWPWTFPQKTHFEYPTYEKNFVPEYLHQKYPLKEMPLTKPTWTYPAIMDKTYEHEYPLYYPYVQDKFYKPTEKFVPFYEKYLPKFMPQYEKFMPQYEKFMPKYEKFVPFYEKFLPKFMPQYEKFMPKYEKFVPEYEKFVPFYEKFLPKYEKFVPEFEKFVPTYEKFMPKYEKFVSEFEKFVPTYEKFLPKYEKFVPEFKTFVPTYEKFMPKYEKFVPEYEKIVPTYEKFFPTEALITKTLATEKVFEVPKTHEEFVYPKFEKFSPLWYKYFGYKHVPYHYETSEYYPKYFEQTPFHYGLY